MQENARYFIAYTELTSGNSNRISRFIVGNRKTLLDHDPESIPTTSHPLNLSPYHPF